MMALEKFRFQIQKRVQENHGEIIQFYGNGCLAIFQSSVNAVACAMDLQKEMQSEPKGGTKDTLFFRTRFWYYFYSH